MPKMLLSTENVEQKVKIQVGDSSPKLIEWSLDMKVNLPNFRNPIIHRIKRVIYLAILTLFVLVLCHLKEEVRALQMQMQDVNTNLVVMMFKYEKLNRSLNRMKLFRESPDLMYATRTKKQKSPEFSDSRDLGLPKIREIVNDIGEEERKSRVQRSLMAGNKRNVSIVARSRSDEEEYYETEGSENREDVRVAKGRRDEGRGKIRKFGEKRRPKRKRLGIPKTSMTTFIGAVPEQHMINSVYIGPWVKSNKTDLRFNFNKFHLVEDRMSIEVNTAGLYMISTQIYYFGEYNHHSYWVLLSSEGSSSSQKLVKCAVAPGFPNREVSCHTSVVAPLKKGDRLYIQQQEREGLINLREGYSYIQLTFLSSPSDIKRRFS